jgi:hypothetical protein
VKGEKMKEVIINENKSKMIKLLILGSVMLLASIYILVNGLIEANTFFIIVGAVATIFFGGCFTFIVKRALNPKPLLLIAENGITDMSTASSVGFISWEEIQAIKVQKSFTEKFIGITVYDLNKLMKRISLEKQIVIKISLILKYTPISISLNTAELEFDTVLDLLQKKLEEHRMNLKE